jgi:two-component system, NtrC family, nitrogen regulation response regulator NtrX
MTTILIADDNLSICESLEQTLTKEGYKVFHTQTPKDFLKLVKEKEPDIGIVDIFYGDNQPQGDWLVKQMSQDHPSIPCIVMSGESDIYKIITCLKNGAQDFIEKPISLPRLITSVKNTLKIINAKSFGKDKCSILGNSQSISDVLFRIKKIGPLQESVLITGESGTGKELVAENLHLFSNRFEQPFYRINCAALSPTLIESELFGYKKGSFTGAEKDKKGYFELASNGSLFLDEIGDLPLDLQTKLLRVLQEKKLTPVGSSEEIEVNTRVICATHQNLEKMIKEGKFREDLYFRITTFKIQVPPLRERLEDIDTLAPYFLQSFLNDNNLGYKELDEAAIQKLKSFDYPGNIRELSIIIKNAALFCDKPIITSEFIECHSQERKNDLLLKTNNMTLTDSKYFFEKELLLNRLKKNNQNVEAAAKSLGLVKTNLYRKFKEHNIEWK